MILVDTSVLIDYLKGIDNSYVRVMEKILQEGIPYGINDFIYQELLQGARTLKEFKILKEYLETLPFYNLKDGLASFEKAALINIKCRKSGITVRSSIDLLIAESAIENEVLLLHNDKDFDYMAKVIPDLKIFKPMW
ncbi:MAG: Ribonuclease VapC11 [Spirochaetes bacterium ADurb.Bin218]|mgnify:CR=1 FL=1|jgi:hypothetical protein|nr:MAG: Ribonuclease VapC11 [Spirochaetes bacterium ADurb.Bin218]HOQ13228.1 PIN domain nuclease [Spirochaetota bacterium]HOV09947.1 PIN domain nuclease [Spirochaetota bacterium]HPX92108.1 PIN domain nuclease [Spirochaetota bacterium]